MIKLEHKIKKFGSLVELMNEINLDKKSNNILSRRFPVRFIFLESFETFRTLIMELDRNKVQIVDIEKMLPMPDGWITKDELFTKIESFNGDTSIVPFSEIARFYEKIDFQNFFNRLTLLENTSDLCRRIYLPLIGLEQRFEKDFFQNFSRKSESPAIWGINEKTPHKVKVILTEEISVKELLAFRVLKNTEEWLSFWKKEYSPCNIICCSKPLGLRFYNSLPDSIFTIERIGNTKELVEQVFGKNIPIEYHPEEQEFWDKLLSLINSEFSTFNHFVKEYCEVTTLTVNNLLPVWIEHTDSFTRWLLRHYIISQDCLSDKYLYKVFNSIDNYSDQTFLEHLFLDIFPIDDNLSFIKDRDNLIKLFRNNISISENIVLKLEAEFNSILDVNKALEICTGLFTFEKEFILHHFIKGDIPSEKMEHILPEILFYIGHTTFENLKDNQSWAIFYLSNYKKAKLADKYIDEITETINKNNLNESSFFTWYHSFESSRNILHQSQIDKTYWVDGLGIEWVSFIENYINSMGNDMLTTKKMIGRSELPTSTEHNKFDNIDKKIDCLDKYIHDNPYKFPKSIFDEFEVVKRIVDSIITNLSDNQSVAIVSDHGLTCLSRLVESRRYGKNDSHEGRYIEVTYTENCTDTDYIKYKSDINDKNYLIALKHNSLGRKPIREVHGGCTPEEVLVPILIISNRPTLQSIEYDIEIVNTEIQRLNPEIEFCISGNPSIVQIEVNTKRTKLTYNTGNNRWSTTLDKSLTGHQKIKIIVGKVEKVFEINIKTGIQMEDLF